MPPAPARTGVAPWAAALLSILFAAGGLIGGYLYAGSRHQEASPAAATLYRLGLSAQIEDGVIRLSWDNSAAALRDALKGVVTVEDGDNTRTIELETADLARGRMRFRSQAKKVEIRMDVFTAEHSGVTESLSFEAP